MYDAHFPQWPLVAKPKLRNDSPPAFHPKRRNFDAMRGNLVAHPEWRAHPSCFDAVLLQRQGEYWQIELVQDAFCPGWW
jgi:hypothetical protein